MNCIFCKIAAKEEAAEILYEDKNVISFLDINPMNYGHALVIPKNHYDNFLEVPPPELAVLIHVVQKVSAALKNSLNTDGINLVANNGRAAGQSVFHFHFHVIPRFHDDEFRFKINLKKYSNGVIREFADKIRREIKNKENKNG